MRKKLSDSKKKLKKFDKSIIPSIAVIVILSIFISQEIIEYYSEMKDLESLRESLIIETDENLKTVEAFYNVIENIKDTDETFNGRFSTIVLEEAIKNNRFGLEEITVQYKNGTLGKKKIKNFLRDTLSDMTFANQVLSIYDGFFVFDEDKFDSFVRVKRQNYDEFERDFISKIKRNLPELKKILENEETVVHLIN